MPLPLHRRPEFRIYYNHTIHPELVRLERKRKNLLSLLAVSIVILLGVIALEIFINIFLATLVLMVLLGLYIVYLITQIRKFVVDFKPRIVNLILDFMEIEKAEYHPKKLFPKSEFMASRIFSSPAPSYVGEDYIKGQIGEVDFEMGEINVREYSKVRSRLNYVFKGIMLKADFEERIRGKVYILPTEFQQYLTRSVKHFLREDAAQVSVGSEAFEDLFLVYATPDVYIDDLLTEEMQDMLVDCRERVGKGIYLSFINSNIYIAVTEEKNILEPYIFQSNVSFELVREFYEDLQLVFSIIKDFDEHH